MGVEHTKVKMVEKSGDKVTSAVDGLPIEIMRLILTYVPSRDLLLNCSRVCKQWRELVSDDVLWRRRCESASVMCPTQCTDESSLFTDYSFYQRLCVFRPFDRNLVKNWNAADGLKHWSVTADGGDGFVVEPDKCPGSQSVSTIGITGCDKCWATSFGWCCKNQLIDLFAAGLERTWLKQLHVSIEVSDWVTCRFDCGSVYELEIELWSWDHKVLDQQKIEKQWNQWDVNSWQKVTHTFTSIAKDVQYVYIEHSGKDTQFWSGHYGPKIAATSVVLKCL